MQKPYLEAGKIVNTHGVRGEVRIQPWADDAAFLLGFRTFYIDGAPVHVAHSRVHKGMLVAKFADYDDVNAAMTLKNRVVSIARADVTLPDGHGTDWHLMWDSTWAVPRPQAPCCMRRVRRLPQRRSGAP